MPFIAETLTDNALRLYDSLGFMVSYEGMKLHLCD